MSNVTTQPSAWLGAEEMSRHLGISAEHLRRLCRAGTLPAHLQPHRLGPEGHYRWSRAVVVEALRTYANECDASAKVYDLLEAIITDKDADIEVRKAAFNNQRALMDGTLDVPALLADLRKNEAGR